VLQLFLNYIEFQPLSGYQLVSLTDKPIFPLFDLPTTATCLLVISPFRESLRLSGKYSLSSYARRLNEFAVDLRSDFSMSAIVSLNLIANFSSQSVLSSLISLVVPYLWFFLKKLFNFAGLSHYSMLVLMRVSKASISPLYLVVK
jgi:hypothetical protein